MDCVLIDACGWAALIDADLNIDISMSKIVGKPRYLLLEKVKQYNKHEKKEKKIKKQCLTDNEKQIEDILSNYIFGGKINSLNDDEIDKLSNKIDMLEKQFMCEM